MRLQEGTRVLLTGGTGFIGANLTRALLSRGASVHLLCQPSSSFWRINDLKDRLTIHQADLLEAETVQAVVQAAQPQGIFHLAMAPGHPSSPAERSLSLAVATLGTAHLLEAARAAGVARVVHGGSSLEYGPRERALEESDPLQPKTFRGLAKATASMVASWYALHGGLNVTILGFFSVYGPWESPSRFIPTVLRAALQGEEIRLTAPGFRHDFVFVEDVVAACLRAAEAELASGEVFNIGSGQQWANEEVVALVERLVGHRLPVRVGAYPAQPPDTHHWQANIAKARALLGWAPAHSLEEGLRKTLTWMQEHHDQLG
ncbi:hypothetical protein EG19_00700 [Thermoanaerobaculum aquaticum]|uniref:NAD-dependent epimerase/dehydratase domain-containing protein n=1 Tax=Thermoanaerobaculum aquaticum TaxID=1312852 RepID=A0A062XNG0_9BACT|nr:NAD-dependent epimerase/dehydratase family protein [Thermoanaerobaculum aquaticum]KDA54117.1 hypothetical protein EG19_00700 [Thermoanaerobaculum aquaticum]